MKLILLSLFLYALIAMVFSHGRLIEPPSRSTAWRYGFKTSINYNDHELFCGGFQVQWEVNGGKCGICGDPYNGERKNELPNGIYARNLVVTRNYNKGDTFTAKVQLTANHYGSFQFKLCPATTMNFEVTQECLDANVLQVLNSKEKFKYILPSKQSKTFEIQLKLPDNISCSRCVLQWTYTAGNNWGTCGDGTSKVGCGQQETFRACADVRIDESERPKPLTISSTMEEKFITSTIKQATEPETESPEVNEIVGHCRAIDAYKSVPSMNDWCKNNCARGFCPHSHCACTDNE